MIQLTDLPTNILILILEDTNLINLINIELVNKELFLKFKFELWKLFIKKIQEKKIYIV